MKSDESPFGLETITPKDAARYLEKFSNIRKLRPAVVKKYARAMREKRWDVNGETVKFNCDSTCIDGEHRLRACIEAGVPFRTYVVRGVRDKNEINTGITRTAQQLLGGMGYANGNQLAAALRMLWAHLGDGGLRHYTQKTVGSNSELLDLLEAHPGIVDSVEFAGSMGHRTISPSVLGFVHYIGSKSDKEMADLFVEEVQKGENIRRGNPAYALRQRLTDGRGARGTHLHPRVTLAWTVKAWTAYVKEQALRVIRWSAGEPFPEMP